MTTRAREILIVTGLLCWGIAGVSHRVELVEWILMLAPLALVPWSMRSLPATRFRSESSLRSLQLAVAFPAAICFGLAFLFVDPRASLALVLPWAGYTLIGAVEGAIRLFARRDLAWAERLSGLGQALMVVGSTATCLAILEIRPFGFPVGIILLTGVHFHYTAWLLPLLVLLLSRAQTSLAGRALATLLMGGIFLTIPLVAIGLIASPEIEIAGVVGLAVCCVSIAMLQFATALAAPGPGFSANATRRNVGRACLMCSAVSLLVAMALAVVYGWGEFRGLPVLGIDTMIRTHGVLNAFGFVGLGAVGWLLLGAAPESFRREDRTDLNRIRDDARTTGLSGAKRCSSASG